MAIHRGLVHQSRALVVEPPSRIRPADSSPRPQLRMAEPLRCTRSADLGLQPQASSVDIPILAKAGGLDRLLRLPTAEPPSCTRPVLKPRRRAPT
mmetsp:Transcript_8436/g.21650  ORF Transcript_8436/g.21650 Transcript_8436/m.21650 type:complete len:95 (+) Transcript_8436:790-1074(+)